jgi:hypothetical protein
MIWALGVLGAWLTLAPAVLLGALWLPRHRSRRRMWAQVRRALAEAGARHTP